MNFADFLESADLDDIIDRLHLYAKGRLKSNGVKNFGGREPMDFVSDLILKVIEERRTWNGSNYSFTEFLFGALKSEISNFFSTNKEVFSLDNLPEVASDSHPDDDILIRKKIIIELLEHAGADDDEIFIFDCWSDGLSKPSEIARDLDMDVKKVNNISKRLNRRLQQIQSQAKHII